MSDREFIEGYSLGLKDLESTLASARSAAKAGDRALAERLYLEIVASSVSDVPATANLVYWRCWRSAPRRRWVG